MAPVWRVKDLHGKLTPMRNEIYHSLRRWLRYLSTSPPVIATGVATTAALVIGQFASCVLPSVTGVVVPLMAAGFLVSYIVAIPVTSMLQDTKEPPPAARIISFRRRQVLARLSGDMSSERMARLKANYERAKGEMLELQQGFVKQLRNKEKNLPRSDRHRLLQQPAWTAVLPTSSDSGRRLVLGLRNAGCSYRRSSPPGCFVCGFNARILHSMQPQAADLDRQLRRALFEAAQEEYDALEFLGDGSFLNDAEIGDETKRRLFVRINRAEHIRRILVESRPGDVDVGDLEILTNSLTRGQEIEIGIGLETADDHIRQYCLNKGFRRRDFEEALDLLENQVENPERISVVAYLLLKPPFLNEEESLSDIVKTLSYLSELQRTHRVRIIPKIEPAVVTRGTVLESLLKERKYDPVSFWTVVEVIARAHELGFGSILRIGGRYDMYEAERIPGVYSQEVVGMLDQYDFLVYNSVMAYNRHHDLVRLLADVGTSRQQGCFSR
mgnify:CR=1 FL=1